MNFGTIIQNLLTRIPARYRKLVYVVVGVVSAVVPVLAQSGVLHADGAKQIGALVTAITAALAGANVSK